MGQENDRRMIGFSQHFTSELDDYKNHDSSSEFIRTFTQSSHYRTYKRQMYEGLSQKFWNSASESTLD
jgi:hypothetical protein